MDLLSVGAIYATLRSDQGYGAKRTPEDPNTRPQEYRRPSILTYESFRGGVEGEQAAAAAEEALGEVRV